MARVWKVVSISRVGRRVIVFWCVGTSAKHFVDRTVPRVPLAAKTGVLTAYASGSVACLAHRVQSHAFGGASTFAVRRCVMNLVTVHGVTNHVRRYYLVATSASDCVVSRVRESVENVTGMKYRSCFLEMKTEMMRCLLNSKTAAIS